MKRFELNSSKWTKKKREQAYKKLQELGYVAGKYHGKLGCNGLFSMSAYSDGTYRGYDYGGVRTDLIIPFKEFMKLTKEDVK